MWDDDATGESVPTKADVKKRIDTYSAPRGRFEIVTVPAMPFLMIDGQGDPNTSREYADALATIYPVAYTLKFLSKNEVGRDYTVMPLEALWWSDDMDAFTLPRLTRSGSKRSTKVWLFRRSTSAGTILRQPVALAADDHPGAARSAQ